MNKGYEDSEGRYTWLVLQSENPDTVCEVYTVT
jgi:hypothetical protein